MPRIPDELLSNVIYLYESYSDAETGKEIGGTGFLTAVKSKVDPTKAHLVAVTNYHVAVSAGASVIRINTKDNGSAIINLDICDWCYDHKSGNDLAVALVPIEEDHNFEFTVLPLDLLLTRSDHKRMDVSPGEDVFMVGRFVDHDGKTTNRPAVRFGNLSINVAPLKVQAFDRIVDVFCLDTNSRTGYSGSPVFLYRSAQTDLKSLMKEEAPSKENFRNQKIFLSGPPQFRLLGVHTAQFPEYWDLKEKSTDQSKEANSVFEVSGAQIKGMSGMSICTPAWGILDLIQSSSEVQRKLTQEEKKLHTENSSNS